ncbi:DUF6201 family protein [Plesiomonas shigelloides]|uniref:DUF6201 family protein n=1 Tax=Plesiomonas shigelloides TaxID=703 RepID=UPI0039AF06D0
MYWFALAHVSLNFLDSPPEIVRFSEDRQYRVTINDMCPVNPIGWYCFLTTESPIYFSLYDAENNYIGKSSPFSCYVHWIAGYLLFPNESKAYGDDGFVVLDDSNNGELNIGIRHKRWWSWWFGLFHWYMNCWRGCSRLQ